MIEENEAPSLKRSGSVADINTHRRFASVDAYVSELGGDKGRVISKILIANNGNAAVKCIRSIRSWAYEMFGNEKAISFVVMATPEDLKANAEYIRVGDIIVDVPGGSNNNNYANVDLIVEIARLWQVHAVWAGWGHASENPVLPNTLASNNPPIKFIGPDGPPMKALGDKIGSTIIAQNAGVPCIRWNGEDVKAEYDVETGTLPEKAYEEGTIHNASEASTAAEKIGFPVMIKASEGGGGKGIRMVSRPEDVPSAYRQVCGEVPGSPIFIMKLSQNSRHLEVQLLGDEYGNVVALNGRDCSVQRRHQKIIEEGPPVAAAPDVWEQMEKAAVSLAKAVHYANAGTVEYLYSEPEEKFYFLELNPRLQVEHPVTEMITKVNLPAAQLQVAMGIPLYHIPEIRELYNKNRFVYNIEDGSSVIDFDNEQRVKPNGHCIAVRITAENAEQGFKPTSGGIQELNFRSTPNVWGYFSMDSSGSIHEFADSQFGHLFASGPDREHARKSMVLALKELSIRGDISTTIEYISKLLELDDFVQNRIDTGWLDVLIKNHASELLSPKNNKNIGKKNNLTTVVIGATILAYEESSSREIEFAESLKKGQLPPLSLLKKNHDVELILDDIKYNLSCTRSGPKSFMISVKGNPQHALQTNIRILSDNGYLIEIGGKSQVAYLTNKGDAACGMRLSVGGADVVFSPDYDPTTLRTDVAGKLVKKILPEGAHVEKGEPYAEIEVMKMFMPLKVKEDGILSWTINEGAALTPGQLLATLELDNPDDLRVATVFEGDFTGVEGWPTNGKKLISDTTSKARSHILYSSAMQRLRSCMAGYSLDEESIENALEDLYTAITDPLLPVFVINKPLSALSGRIDATLFSKITDLLSDFEKNPYGKRFPAKQVTELISSHSRCIEEGQATFIALTAPLVEVASPFVNIKESDVPGSGLALADFIDILQDWIEVEQWFCESTSYADAVNNLRRANKDDHDKVRNICMAHAQLKSTSSLVMHIIKTIGFGTTATRISEKKVQIIAGAERLHKAIPCLSEIGAMGRDQAYADVSLQARKLLLAESLSSISERKTKLSHVAYELMRSASKNINFGKTQPEHISALTKGSIPFSDIFLPMLQSSADKQMEISLAEIYVRKVYHLASVLKLNRMSDERLISISFFSKPNENVMTLNTPIASMSNLAHFGNKGPKKDAMKPRNTTEDSMHRTRSGVDLLATRTGIFKLVDKLEDVGSTFTSILKIFPSCKGMPVNVLHIAVVHELISRGNKSSVETAGAIENMLVPHHDALKDCGVKSITIIIGHDRYFDGVTEDYPMPAIFTFLVDDKWKEMSLLRHSEPNHANHMGLGRMAENFDVISLSSQQASSGDIHLYKATPNSFALANDKRANKAPRVFVRVFSFMQELTSSYFEELYVDSLNALDLGAHIVSKADNHLFINLVNNYERVVLDPVIIEQTMMSIIKKYTDRMARLGLVEVEIKFVCSLSEDSMPIALRIVVSNPTGYVSVVNSYVEAKDTQTGLNVFKQLGGTKASLSGSGDSSWEGLQVNFAYPLTRPFDMQRRAALKSSDSLYCYDLPALFEAAVEQQWNSAVSTGGSISSKPQMVMFTTELVVQRKSGTGPWTMENYLKGDLEIVQTNKKAGSNNVGMVAWLMVINTVEYPDGREMVLIANDITFKAGSFGTREDVVFKLASELAREKRIPRLYVAANSGARIGLAERVKKNYEVAFKDPSQPENGFEYLYVKPDVYKKLSEGKEIFAEPVMYNGEEVYKITDIIGAEPDLGVENLKGSGLIAGETSSAYNDIFTMTVVLGRTVGIGAYLVRLGQRTIQKTTQSPIILTGYQALNKLMGVDVYSTNDQLGGPAIMYQNGISHIVAPDPLQVIFAAVEWLSYVPSTRGGILPISNISGMDTIERDVDFSPSPGVPYDPRHLITGCEDINENWQSGFFDKGSFKETLAGWANSVIVGRARLGGIPMGVIATENRTMELIKPADPADTTASESIIQQAGCVWFPNSAYKTAQAINDFRTEDLPLMVFANWRGFSGGQRDMFDEVLKYGSLIVDAFVAYKQPVFVLIPPYAEVRGGAWVVLDSSINESVMEMYAASKTARGGVLEAVGAASVKYRMKDLIPTMHRLDSTLIDLDTKLKATEDDNEIINMLALIKARENDLFPVYGQISIQFCDLHDTPGRMKAVGAIKKEVEWKEARTFFFWRLRRKLAEYNLRKAIEEASQVGRGSNIISPMKASALLKTWFLDTSEVTDWDDDKAVLSWMTENNDQIQQLILKVAKDCVSQEVIQVMLAGGNTALIGTSGIVQGIAQALQTMGHGEKENVKKMLKEVLDL